MSLTFNICIITSTSNDLTLFTTTAMRPHASVTHRTRNFKVTGQLFTNKRTGHIWTLSGMSVFTEGTFPSLKIQLRLDSYSLNDQNSSITTVTTIRVVHLQVLPIQTGGSDHSPSSWHVMEDHVVFSREPVSHVYSISDPYTVLTPTLTTAAYSITGVLLHCIPVIKSSKII